MSPDSPDPSSERLVAAAIDAAIRRARMLGLAEAVAWGLAAAALSFAAGAWIAAGIAVWRWRAISRASIVRALERAPAAPRLSRVCTCAWRCSRRRTPA